MVQSAAVLAVTLVGCVGLLAIDPGGALAQDDAAPVKRAGLQESDVASDRAPRDENDERWHATVRDIVKNYQHWQRIDDILRWAPTLCSLPPSPPTRMSEAKKDTPHARKLYVLYAKDAKGYGVRASDPLWTKDEVFTKFDHLEQVIVKRTWKPERMKEAPDERERLGLGRGRLAPLKVGDHWVEAGDAAGLFVMFKPKATDIPTDQGWVYATVTPKGDKITGAGRMASCMQCHKKHKNRLFGPPKELRVTDEGADAPTRGRDGEGNDRTE